MFELIQYYFEICFRINISYADIYISFYRTMMYLTAGFICILVTIGTGHAQNVDPVSELDIDRYTGRWLIVSKVNKLSASNFTCTRV